MLGSRVIRKLGEGEQGPVSLVQTAERERYAMKRIYLPEIESYEIINDQEEEHPHVVRLLRKMVDPENSIAVIGFFEIAPLGSLQHIYNTKGALWRKNKPFRVEHVKLIVSQIGSAIDYIASLGLCHNDAHLGNILVFEPGLLKLSDFGLAEIGRRGDDDFEASAAAHDKITLYTYGVFPHREYAAFMSEEQQMQLAESAASVASLPRNVTIYSSITQFAYAACAGIHANDRILPAPLPLERHNSQR